MEGSLTPDTTDKGEAPNLASLKKMFEEASDLTKTARAESRIDDDYYHGYQWTPEERRALRKRKQPDLVFNRIRPSVNGTLGVLKQGETDPRAYPRNPQDEDSADVASKVLRFVADKNDFDALKLDGAQNYLVQGTCAAIVEVDDDKQVTVEPIRWEEFFYDPRSRRQDFRDARYLGVAKWMYADDVAALYPEAKDAVSSIIAAGGDTGAVDETFEDRPTDGSGTVAWVDKKKSRIMVVELYHREGKDWRRCVYHTGGLLDYGPSPYLDEKRRPACPIEAQSCFVDRENNRYGVVRDMRGPQDEINKRRSKALHLLNTRQVQESQPGLGMGEINEVRAEAAKPDGVLPSGWEIIPNSDLVSGQMQLLAEAKAEIERMGPNPAILGRQGENQSGRANLVRQQAGLTEQAIIFGGIEDWELRIYRQIWARVRQFWTEPQFIRVTDDEGAPDFVGINQPPEMPGPDGQPAPGQMLGVDPQSGKPAFRMPDGSVVLGYQNGVAELDVDIMLDSVPDTANVQQEQFQMLAELAKSYPQDVTFDDLLEASSMPNKRQIVEKRKARKEEASQQQGGAQQLQMRGAMAEVAKTESEVALNQAKTQTEMAKPGLEAAKLQQADQQFAGEMIQQDRQAQQQPPPGFGA